MKIRVYNDDKLVKTITKNADIWKNSKRIIEVSLNTPETITNIILGNAYIPDANKKDNKYVLTQLDLY